MTAKEKADELVNKFYDIKINPMYSRINEYMAKQCALIAVDEIIKAFRKDLPEVGLGKGFWGEVKLEIEKL